MKVGELIDVRKMKLVQKGSVAAGHAPRLDLGTVDISIGQTQSTGATSRVREGVNPQYLKGLNKDEKSVMKREIKRFSKMDHRDKDAYPDDWTADRDYKKRGGKTTPSKHTEKFHAMFGEEQIDESNVDTALKNKAEKTGKSLSLLRKVYNRGLAAWRTGHRPGVSQHQWAMARVNSFLTGGKAAQVDKDLKG